MPCEASINLSVFQCMKMYTGSSWLMTTHLMVVQNNDGFRKNTLQPVNKQLPAIIKYCSTIPTVIWLQNWYLAPCSHLELTRTKCPTVLGSSFVIFSAGFPVSWETGRKDCKLLLPDDRTLSELISEGWLKRLSKEGSWAPEHLSSFPAVLFYIQRRTELLHGQLFQPDPGNKREPKSNREWRGTEERQHNKERSAGQCLGEAQWRPCISVSTLKLEFAAWNSILLEFLQGNFVL